MRTVRRKRGARSPQVERAGSVRRAEGDDRAADLEIIEHLLHLALDAVAKKAPEVRLADVLKLLEFKRQIKPEVDARRLFWEWIARLQQETPAGGESSGPDQSGKEHEDEHRD